jgi:DNA-binding NtrC family response regulator
LRERGDDVLQRAEHFLALHARRYGKEGLALSATARQSLLSHRWPGNVRELRNVIEQAVLMASGATVESLEFGWPGVGAAGGAEPPVGSTLNLDQLERETIAKALEAAKWNVSRAARVLGVTRDALRYRMDKHGLSIAE